MSGKLVSDAEAALAEGRDDLAAELFRAVLECDPNRFEALMGLGVIQARTGQWQDAVQWLERAARADGRSAQVQYNLGAVLKRLNRSNDAIHCFEAALSLDPTHLAACGALANSLAAQGRTGEAILRYEQALTLNPDHGRSLYNLAVLLQTSGQTEDAAVLYQRAVAVEPGFAPAWANLGTILTERGATQDAEMCFRRALDCDSGLADARVNLGLLLHRLGRRDEALVLAQDADALPMDADFPHYALGLLFAKLADIDVARRHLDRSVVLDPGDVAGARLVLASLGAAPAPERASDAQLHHLYASRAATWDDNANRTQAYRGHLLVAHLFGALYPDPAALTVLDAGCGTGLVAEALSGRVARLDGVDLSDAMLDRARAKGLYAQVYRADLVAFMNGAPGAYDVITSAATLIHFGDLRPVLAAASNALRPGGRFLFTVFPAADDLGDDPVVSLSMGHVEGGCYLHSRRHLATAAAAAGLQTVISRTEVHEFFQGAPVQALVVALQKGGAASGISNSHFV